MSVLMNVLSSVGIQAFGISMPRIAWNLWKENLTITPQTEPAGHPLLTLQADMGAGNPAGFTQGDPAAWVAPLAGTLREVDTADPKKGLGVRLLRADGTPDVGKGALLTIFPQIYVRLMRLYNDLLEAAPAARGVPVRPVPRYFFYTVEDMTLNAGTKLDGLVNPGDVVGRFRYLRVYDADGMPIDPLAVVSALNRILAFYPALMWLPSVTLQVPVSSGLDQLGQVMGGNVVRARLCDHRGQPHDGTGFGALTPVGAGQGVFTFAAPITRSAGAATSLVIGSPHNGTLGAGFTAPVLAAPAIPGAAAPLPPMYRDFYTLRVLDLQAFLLGPADTSFAGNALQQQPVVRMGEALTLLPHGNAVLATAQEALAAAPAGSQFQCVAPEIRDDFVLPATLAGGTLWPTFGGGAAGGPIGVGLRNGLRNGLTANYVANGAVATPDVVLQITGLPAALDKTVRVYPRRFLEEDAKEARGDGAGALVPAGQGAATVLLRDPFGLVGPDGEIKAVPPRATLRVDLVLTSFTGAGANAVPVARTFGNLDVTILNNNPVPAPAATPGLNALALAGVFRGTCSARLLGLNPPGPPTVGDFFTNLYGTETDTPVTREPARFPTMVYRDLVVSNRALAVLSGGRLAPEAMSAQTRLGAPVSPGGREVQSVGVRAAGGLLPYDLAVASLRRTRYLAPAMMVLFGAVWDPPAAGAGTFAGALLQNIAPQSETPGLYFMQDVMANYATARANMNNPANNLGSLVTLINGNLANHTLTVAGKNIPVSQATQDALTNVVTFVNNNAGTDPTNVRRQRLFQELDRRVVTSVYGRRDSERAIRAGIAQARRFLYLETPGLATTRMDATFAPVAGDLILALQQQMLLSPELQVILCIPRDTDYPSRYADLRDAELVDRTARLASLPPERTVVFHPIGYPGRPSTLGSTLMIVDDVWALIGSSTLRRRGLTFDGSLDMVLTDTVYEGGVCRSIAAFRRAVLALRLGVPAQDTGMPHPTFVRLQDGGEILEVVKETLGRGGVIEPLYVPADPPSPSDTVKRHANPDGAEVASPQGTQLWAELFAREYIGG